MKNVHDFVEAYVQTTPFWYAIKIVERLVSLAKTAGDESTVLKEKLWETSQFIVSAGRWHNRTTRKVLGTKEEIKYIETLRMRWMMSHSSIYLMACNVTSLEEAVAERLNWLSEDDEIGE